MRKVEYDKTVVVDFIACETNTISSTPRSNICRIYTYEGGVVVGIDQTTRLCSTLIDVVDIAICGIGTLIFESAETSMNHN